MAQVAIPISHRDCSAAVAGGGVLLEGGELLAADRGAFAAHREGGVEGFSADGVEGGGHGFVGVAVRPVTVRAIGAVAVNGVPVGA